MSSLTAATSSGSRASRNPTASAPKKATASQRTGRDSDEATCQTSVLMKRNVMNSSSIGSARVTSGKSDPSSLEGAAQGPAGDRADVEDLGRGHRTEDRGVGEERAERPVAVPAQGRDHGRGPDHEDGQLHDAHPPGPLHRLAVPEQVGQRPDGQQQQEPDAGVEQPGRPRLVGRHREEQGAEIGHHEHGERAAVDEVVHLDGAALDEERQPTSYEPGLGLADRLLAPLRVSREDLPGAAAVVCHLHHQRRRRRRT